MRKIRSILVLAVCCMMLMPTVVSAVSKPEDFGKVDIDSKEVPEGNAGDKMDIAVPLINREIYDVKDVIVTVIPNKDVTVYPFTIPTTNVFQPYDDMVAKVGTSERTFPLTVRKDAPSDRYEIKFKIEYTLATTPDPIDVSIVRSIFVNINGAEVTPTVAPVDPGHDDGGGSDSGGYDGGGGSYDGGSGSDDADKKSAKPRVVIDGFRTEPKVVHAGTSFKLILEVRNTSKKTAVSNMEINLQAAGAGDSTPGEDSGASASDTFLPDKGSNTLYVDSIKADTTKEVSIDLTARADLQQRPYSIGIAMAYEDSKANEYTATSEISIPIKQEARLEISKVEVMPEAIEVGGEGNITFSIYNLGRTKLYNVQVKLDKETIYGGEAFVGNLEAGATGEVDLMVTGEMETTDDGTVPIIISYEDQDGNKSTYEDSCTIFVMPMMDEGEIFMDEGMEILEESTGISMPAKIGIGAAALAAIGAVTYGIIRHRRKKEEDFADEFLGSDKDERK